MEHLHKINFTSDRTRDDETLCTVLTTNDEKLLLMLRRQYTQRTRTEMADLRTINRMIRAYAFAGFCVASYALYVELSLENDPNFQPLCDIREYINCSPAFVSPYARGFGIVGYLFGEDTVFNVPNGLTGMIFYALSMALSCSNIDKIIEFHYYLVIASNLLTFYLAFVLAFIVKELCLVCLTTYLINAVSLLCLAFKRRQKRQQQQKDD